MPKITVKSPPGAAQTRLWLDDVEVQDIRSLSLHFEVADVVTAKVEVLATDALHIDVTDGRVFVEVVAMPGYVVSADFQQPDGRVIYRAEKDESA